MFFWTAVEIECKQSINILHCNWKPRDGASVCKHAHVAIKKKNFRPRILRVRKFVGRNLMYRFNLSDAENTGAQPEIFQGRVGFVELGHFDKLFVKKCPAGKTFEAFSPRYS